MLASTYTTNDSLGQLHQWVKESLSLRIQGRTYTQCTRVNCKICLKSAGLYHGTSKCFIIYSLNWTIHGREIQLFCYITNSRIMENENASVT